MTQRINYMQQSPELFKKFVAFGLAVKETGIETSIWNWCRCAHRK